MVARFSNFLGILNNAVKTGNKFIEVPINKLCLQTLRILRRHNLIFGFQYISPGKKTKRLYPRVRIYIKYADANSTCIHRIRPIKNAFSNFIIDKQKFSKQITTHRKIMITTPKGLSLFSFNDFQEGLTKKKGKKLVEIYF